MGMADVSSYPGANNLRRLASTNIGTRNTLGKYGCWEGGLFLFSLPAPSLQSSQINNREFGRITLCNLTPVKLDKNPPGSRELFTGRGDGRRECRKWRVVRRDDSAEGGTRTFASTQAPGGYAQSVERQRKCRWAACVERSPVLHSPMSAPLSRQEFPFLSPLLPPFLFSFLFLAYCTRMYSKLCRTFQ